MNKWKERFELIYDLVRDYKKTALTILVILSLTGYMVWTRTPAAIKCWYNASFISDIPSDRWRFNIFPTDWERQCQRQRGDGMWIPYEKVSDVGVVEDLQ